MVSTTYRIALGNARRDERINFGHDKPTCPADFYRARERPSGHQVIGMASADAGAVPGLRLKSGASVLVVLGGVHLQLRV